MKNIGVALLAIAAIFSLTPVFARDAQVKTKDGQEMFIQTIGFHSNDSTCFAYDRADDIIRVYKKDGNATGVPLATVVRIERREETNVFEIAYLWRTVTNVVTGKLGGGFIIGSNAIGRLELKIQEIQSLRFKDPPIEMVLDPNFIRQHNSATLTLAGGSSLTLEDVEVNAGFNRSFRKPVNEPGLSIGAYEWAYASGSESVHYLQPMIAGQKQNVFVSSIAALETTSATELKVTTTDGSTMSLKLTSENGLVGVNGVSEKDGLVFLPLQKVSKIIFVHKETSKPKKK